MQDILDKYKKEILWEKPIEIYGLLLYPIRMKDAIDFYSSSGTMMIDQTEIQDEQLLKLSYLELIYAFIISEEKMKTETKEVKDKVCFKDKLFNLLSLCLQININEIEFGVKTEEDKQKLLIIINQNGRKTELTKGKFDKFRRILCGQNSIELPDLSVNSEIRKNAELLKQSSEDFDLMNLIYSVCAIGRYSLSDVENWSLYRFNKIVEAMEKEKNYTLYKGAELGGMVSFKNGNPIKTWLLTKVRKDYGIMTAQEMSKVFTPEGAKTNK